MSRFAVAVAIMAGCAVMDAAIVCAATLGDFDSAYKAAREAEQEAEALHNRWIPTETALATAQKAADGKDYDQAVALAHQAEALAKASIEQAREQDKHWQDAVIK